MLRSTAELMAIMLMLLGFTLELWEFRSARRLLVTASVVPSSPILVTLMKGALSSSETPVTWCNIPEDDILHSHRRENLKSCRIWAGNRTYWTLTDCNYKNIRSTLMYTLYSSLQRALILVNLPCSDWLSGNYLQCCSFCISHAHILAGWHVSQRIMSVETPLLPVSPPRATVTQQPQTLIGLSVCRFLSRLVHLPH
jgi:hypothetical protein